MSTVDAPSFVLGKRRSVCLSRKGIYRHPNRGEQRYFPYLGYPRDNWEGHVIKGRDAPASGVGVPNLLSIVSMIRGPN